MTALSVTGLTMRFGGLTALEGVSFTAPAGRITAIIGPNGAGKTTLFNCITGFYRPGAGRIALGHSDITGRAGHAIARAGVARTFQNIRLFPGLTALENLLVAQHGPLTAGPFATLAGLLGLPSAARAEREAIDHAAMLLGRFGLSDRADTPAGDLPYGAQRGLEIARALATRPRVLLLDEPAAGLNATESAQLNRRVAAIRDETGIAIVLIEHDMGVVMGLSDSIVVLDYGRKIAEGTPAAIRENPAVIAAYLGVPEDEAEAVLEQVSA